MNAAPMSYQRHEGGIHAYGRDAEPGFGVCLMGSRQGECAESHPREGYFTSLSAIGAYELAAAPREGR